LNDDGGNFVIKGLALEFLTRLKELGGSSGDPLTQMWNPVDPELGKFLLERMYEEAGVQVLYHSFVFDVLKKEDRVSGVVIVNKSGFQAIEAGTVIDCTGDADAAAAAGVECEVHAEGLQPMTLGMRMVGVDWPDWPKPTAEYLAWREESKKYAEHQQGQRGLGMLILGRKGDVFINKTRIPGNGLVVQDRTNAEIEGRRQARRFAEFYRANVPGCGQAFLAETGAEVGVRETRRIRGEYVLTADDILGCVNFSDNIARGHYMIDLHRSNSAETSYTYLPSGKYYGIPYRSLLPRSVDGLIVAGRCISGTHEAAGSFRAMSHGMAMGQAAGTAAALAVKTKIRLRKLDVAVLQKTLTDQGALV
jgi:hypothetical protein